MNQSRQSPEASLQCIALIRPRGAPCSRRRAPFLPASSLQCLPLILPAMPPTNPRTALAPQPLRQRLRLPASSLQCLPTWVGKRRSQPLAPSVARLPPLFSLAAAAAGARWASLRSLGSRIRSPPGFHTRARRPLAPSLPAAQAASQTARRLRLPAHAGCPLPPLCPRHSLGCVKKCAIRDAPCHS